MEEKAEAETLFLQPENSEKKIPHTTKWRTLLLVVATATTVGSAIPVGHAIGVMNSPANYMRKWCYQSILDKYGIIMNEASMEILWSSIVSIFLIGGAIGSLGGSWLADRYGRKGCYLISGFLFFISATLFQFCRMANSVEMLLLGRLIVGLGSGITTAVLPIYLTELAPLALRGTLGVFCPMGVTGGVVIGQVISLQNVLGTEAHWHYALSSFAMLLVICYLPSSYFPESPKFLYIIRKDSEGAKKELYRLLGDNPLEVNKEIEEMEDYMRSKVEAMSLWSVLKDKTLSMPMIIVMVFQGGQQLSGINAVFYYSISIFEKAGLSRSNAELANLGAGSMNLLISLLGPILMSKFNRRPLMMISCLTSGVFLFALAFVINYIELASWLPAFSIVCTLGYIFCFQWGLGPIPYFIGSELVEVAPRSAIMALGSLASWACNFIIGMTFPIGQSFLGSFIFLPCSVTCILMFLLTKFYLPETRGRDPSDVAPLIADGFKSKPT